MTAACFILRQIKSLSARYFLDERIRCAPAHRDFRGRTVVWLHAASLGESRVLIEFLRILNKKHPDHMYLVTAVSETGVKYLRQCKHESVCAAGFMPVDSIPLMTETLSRFSISRLWLVETEIWPSMLAACMSRNIPAGVVNARLEEKSLGIYRRFRFFFGQFISYLNPILAQNEEYAARYRALGADSSHIRITGNIKSRVMVRRPAYEEWKRMRRDMNAAEESIVVTAGCIHAGEAVAIREAIDALVSAKYDWKWIVVPRYLDDVESIMSAMGADAVLLKEPFAAKEWRICVIGAYGLLEDLYRIADAAVVGGSFVDNGGHNVWEAAQFGIPVLWGPHCHEQRDGCDNLSSAGVGFQVFNGKQTADTLVRVLKTEAKSFIAAQSVFMAEHAEDSASLEQGIP
jgi:3-deoxy-D-manno-octulosonic-acid transferase